MKVNLEKLILEKYKKYNFTPLNYQIDIIKWQISIFFNSLFSDWQVSNYITFENNENVIKFWDWENFIKNSWYGSSTGRQKISVINIDVWLWKTITSIISMELIKDLVKEITLEEEKKFLEKKEQILLEEKNEINLTYFKENILEQFEQFKTYYNPIFIIARKSICREFEHILKQSKEEHNSFTILPSWRNLQEEYLQGKNIFYYLNLLIDFNNSFLKWYNFKIIEFKWLIISDEWWTDKTFFWNWQNNRFIENKNNFVIWLTANKEIKHNYFNFKTRRYLKTDEDVKKELIDKKLYSFKDFFYKFIKIDNLNVKTKIKELEELKTNWINHLLDDIKYLNNSKEQLNWIIKEIFNIEKNKIDDTIKKIAFVKNEIEKKNAIDKINNTLNELNNKLDSYWKDLSNIIRKDFYEIFENSNLQYLQEKNSILIYDKKYEKEFISEIKQKFKEDEYKILTSENFRKIDLSKETWNLLIWSIQDISKWLNLQNFDTIIFSYIDDISLEDIYQWIWRLDRLWLSSDKEIILMSYDYTEQQLNSLIDKKEEFNKWTNLNLIKTVTNLENNKKLFELNELIEISKNEQIENLEIIQRKIEYIDKKEENRLKDKIKFIQENKKIFQEMLKNIEEQFSQTKTTLSNLIWNENWEELDKKYLDSIISIL